MLILPFLEATSENTDPLQTIGERLIPSWLSFVVQLSSFIILLLVVFFVAYKPVKRILAKRADYVENQIKEAAENNASALKDNEIAKANVANSKKEASQIIANAEKAGQEKYDEIILEAKAEVSEMKKQAEIDIERAKEDAKQDIRNEMVNVAISASEEILKREVDNADNKRLAEEFIDQLN